MREKSGDMVCDRPEPLTSGRGAMKMAAPVLCEGGEGDSGRIAEFRPALARSNRLHSSRREPLSGAQSEEPGRTIVIWYTTSPGRRKAALDETLERLG